MYKVCLTVFAFLFCSGVSAQTTSLMPPEAFSGFGAIQIAVSTLDDADGDGYFAEAEKFEKKGEFNAAVTLFGKAANEYNNARNFNAYGLALLKLSNAHMLLNHYTEAEQVILNVALKNYSRIGSRSGQMDAYNQLGKVYYAANKLTQSLWFYTQQGILAKQLKDNPAYLDSMLGIIFVKIKKKQYNMALKDVNTAELFARTTKINDYNTHFKYTRSVINDKSSVKN